MIPISYRTVLPMCADSERYGVKDFVYMLDSDLSEPATARGGRDAPPNGFVDLNVCIGAYTKERYLRASLSPPAGKHMTPEYGLIQVSTPCSS